MGKAVSFALIAVIRLYRTCVSPLLGRHCRFRPSCSQYMMDAVRSKGATRGAWMGIRRILRCHPYNPGGHDPVE